jgi:hypothetical protein
MKESPVLTRKFFYIRDNIFRGVEFRNVYLEKISSFQKPEKMATFILENPEIKKIFLGDITRRR